MQLKASLVDIRAGMSTHTYSETFTQSSSWTNNLKVSRRLPLFSGTPSLTYYGPGTVVTTTRLLALPLRRIGYASEVQSRLRILTAANVNPLLANDGPTARPGRT